MLAGGFSSNFRGQTTLQSVEPSGGDSLQRADNDGGTGPTRASQLPRDKGYGWLVPTISRRRPGLFDSFVIVGGPCILHPRKASRFALSANVSRSTRLKAAKGCPCHQLRRLFDALALDASAKFRSSSRHKLCHPRSSHRRLYMSLLHWLRRREQRMWSWI